MSKQIFTTAIGAVNMNPPTTETILDAIKKMKETFPKETLMFGIIVNEKTYDKLIEKFGDIDIKFVSGSNGIQWSGMVIGIHSNIPEGFFIPCKTRERYLHMLAVCEYHPDKLLTMIEELEKKRE